MDEKTLPTAPYTPTASELIPLAKLDARREKQGAFGHIKAVATSPGNVQVGPDHDDETTGWLVMTGALGLSSPKVMALVLDQVCSLAQSGATLDEAKANGMLAIVQSIQPQDTVEALLATQMAAIHMATMKEASRAHLGKNGDARAAHFNTLNKLARTFTAQTETLKKYRSKGEQKVIVEHQHVHVHPGGQAVVGNVSHGVGGEVPIKNEGQPHERSEPLRLSERKTVLGTIEADQVPVQGASGQGLERLPVSRGKGRAALRAVE